MNSYLLTLTIVLWFDNLVYASTRKKLETLKNFALALVLMTTKVVMKLKLGKKEPLQWNLKDWQFCLLNF